MNELTKEYFSISKLEKMIGLPSSTLRYYEKEFAFYLNIPKSAGGHRRYTQEHVQKFLYLKKLIHEQGLSIKEVKNRVLNDEDPKRLRQEVDLLLKFTSELAEENMRIRKNIEDLYNRLNSLEEKLEKNKSFLKRILGS
jgi:DNA-binding transcriptional MerR regulator